MTKTKKPSARELPLVKRRIAALLDKTEANGCTPGETAAVREGRGTGRQVQARPRHVPVAVEAIDAVRLGKVRTGRAEVATGHRIEPWTRHWQARRAADR